jgi:hypothetical protein
MYPEPLTLLREVEECASPITACTITRIECFQLDGELSDILLPGHETDCQCGLLTISTNLGTSGLGRFIIPFGKFKGDFVQWAVVFQRLKGLELKEGVAFVHQKEETWGALRTQAIEAAFTDLAAKLSHAHSSTMERGLHLDRSYLFAHSGAYISF